MTTIMQKIDTAPQSPGCYLYKNEAGNIIYVGKAQQLRQRVRQYFHPSSKNNPKLQQLVKAIVDVEFYVTDTELNALLLEYQLIKKYKPWFNTQFIQEAKHPLIEITMADTLPTISIVSAKSTMDSVYIDCFSSYSQAQIALDIFNRVWKTPLCQKKSFVTKSRPCLRQGIHKCLAPCIQDIQSQEYKNILKEIIRFFNHQRTTVISRLHKEMTIASNTLNFEKAAFIKQDIDTLLYLQHKSQRMFHFPTQQDVILFIRPYHRLNFSIFYIRDKKILQRIDCPSTLSKETLLHSIMIENDSSPIQEPNLLQALTEIVADKLYITLPKHCSSQRMEKELLKGYTSFKNK